MGLKKAIAINPAARWMEGEKYMPEIQLIWRYEHNVDNLNDLRDELALCPAFADWKVKVFVRASLKLPMLIVTGEGLCSILTHLGCP